MRINFHILRIYTFLALILTGCGDKSYRGRDVIPEEESTEPVPVLLSVGEAAYNSIITKGTGAIDNNKIPAWVAVYAFKNTETEEIDFTVTMKHSQDEISPVCLIDATGDDPASLLGKRGTIMEDHFIQWENTSENKQIYFPASNDSYRFYAYYTDDIPIQANQIKRSPDRITLINIKINGSQDLMTAIAGISEKQKKELKQKISKTEFNYILSTLYSSYGARRGVHPTLRLKHHLSRLVFKIYPGAAAATQVNINSISVKTPVKGDFTIVAKDTNLMGIDFSHIPTNAYQPLYLKRKSPEEIWQVTWKDEYKNLPAYSEKLSPQQIGESLLIAPENNINTGYSLKMEMTENGLPESEPTHYELEEIIKAPGDKGFEPGKEYTIKIMVYGKQHIGIIVTESPWEWAGDIIVDEDPEFNQ